MLKSSGSSYLISGPTVEGVCCSSTVSCVPAGVGGRGRPRASLACKGIGAKFIALFHHKRELEIG
jgi:hypothetical protein